MRLKIIHIKYINGLDYIRKSKNLKLTQTHTHTDNVALVVCSKVTTSDNNYFQLQPYTTTIYHLNDVQTWTFEGDTVNPNICIKCMYFTYPCVCIKKTFPEIHGNYNNSMEIIKAALL